MAPEPRPRPGTRPGKERILDLLTGVMVVCALAVVGLLARRELFSAPSVAPPAQGVPVAGWEALAGVDAGGSPRQVQLVVFADYTCRFCRQLEGALDTLQATLGGDVRVVRLHYPLRPGGTGFQAAVAAECAGLQQRKAAYHQLLYAHQDQLGTLPWDSLAAMAGVGDRAAFNACVRDEATAAAVRAQRAQGEAVGIEGTPTFLVNGRRYAGGRTFAELLAQVRNAGS